MEQRPGHEVPEWLQKLQENSWELELLISGGAIFSLFQLTDVFLEWMNALGTINRIPGTFLMIVIGVAIIKTLTFGFSVHLISRAFWLALVCINYVHPNGIKGRIRASRQPFSTPFKTGDDLHRQILMVDRFCGVVIYTTILGAIIAFGLLLGFMPMLLWEFLMGNIWFFAPNMFTGFLLITYLVYLLDFFLFGFLRRVPLLSYLVFPFFWLYDRTTLRLLFHRSLKLLISNTRWWKVGLTFVVLIVVVLVSTYSTLYRRMHWPYVFDTREMKWQMAEGPYITHRSYRKNLEEGELPDVVSIESRVVTTGYLNVFVRYFKKADLIKQKIHGSDSSIYFSDLLMVGIDDSVYSDVKWYPTWNQSLDNLGISAMIRIDHLAPGEHRFQVRCRGSEEEDVIELCDMYNAEIPFWRDMYN
ncbi:MAG: hypothetical protein FJZ75_02480 [Bacteroidetes bacterium]|nr:hypothetical protein [Bacteroidota bacterium]